MAKKTLGRILMISEHADPLAKPGSKEVGGQNVYVLNLARALSKIGWEVDVFTRWDSPKKQRVIKFAQRARVIRVTAGPRHYIPRDELFKYLPDFVDDIVRFRKENGINYDLIHSHYWMSGWCGLKISNLWGIPLISTYHSLGYIRYSALKNFENYNVENKFFKLRLHWEREIAKLSSKVVATSPYEQNDIMKFYGGNSKKIKIIPAGIDPKNYYPLNHATARKSLNIVDCENIILYVGRIEWRKGIGTLIVALSELSKIDENMYEKTRLIIVGRTRGPESKEVKRLKKIAQQFGVLQKITFTGSKDVSDLRKYYSAANVCVVPSYYEPFGIVPLEALACNCPVIASKVGGLQYTVKDGIAGYLVPPRNVSQLATAINRVLEDNSGFRQKVMKYTNKSLLKKFVWNSIAKDISSLYKRTIKDKEI